MKRRRLIKLAALSLAGLALPVAWLHRLRADVFFNELFGDASFAARIGRIHHAQDGEAGGRGRALIADLASRPLQTMEVCLRECVGADLEALDVVVVDGWVMARTEADLCAAVHLDRSLA
ncbi:MAG: hypothetical protein ACR2RF_16335 [Geminicoccaceae bacterium]